MTKSTFSFTIGFNYFLSDCVSFLVKIRKLSLYFMVATVIHGSFLCLLPNFITMFRHLLSLLHAPLLLCPC